MSTRPPTVTVYTQRHCAPCLFTLRWLKDHGIVHRVVHVDEDQAAREKLRALGHRQTPVVETPTGESWSGHSKTFLASLLPDGINADVPEAQTTTPGAAGPDGGTAGRQEAGTSHRRTGGWWADDLDDQRV